ncbi:hypothetical protein CTI12_AA029580 [Artemisia annua]|uniref:Uncharacterized protein n=1 Tax=Artemisia annua TaxID=35608 RepID=A0A2U1QDB7_ARTAN|nr:hypothetical protein CTI12_AA029580 [Artemisia annua]
MDDDTRSEQRLSFSDLQLFANDDENQNPIISSPYNSSHFNQDNFLGFFIEETLSFDTPKTGIIFCGKVIDTSTDTQNPNTKKKASSKKNNNIGGLPRRNSDSISRSNSFQAYIKNEQVSKLASSSRSRWQVFVGSDRFPKKMELSDIRSRQRRRSHGSEKDKRDGNLFSGLIRVLGCNGGFNYDENEMIKSSLRYFPSRTLRAA